MTDGTVTFGQLTLSCERLSLRNYAINSIWYAIAELSTSLNLTQWMGESVSFVLAGQRFVGKVKQVERLHHIRAYQLTIYSPLCALHRKRDRVFSQVSLLTVIESIFKVYNFKIKIHDCPQITIQNLMQYQESDWQLWKRLCQRFQIHFVFMNGQLEVFWQFLPGNFIPIAINYAAGINRQQRALTQWQVCHHPTGCMAFAQSDGPFECLDIVDIDESRWRVVLCDMQQGQRFMSQLLLIPASATDIATMNVSNWLGYSVDFNQKSNAQRKFFGFMKAQVLESNGVAVQFDWADGVCHVPRLCFSADIRHHLQKNTQVLIGFVSDDIDQPVILTSLGKARITSETPAFVDVAMGNLTVKLNQQCVAFELPHALLTMTEQSIRLNSYHHSRFTCQDWRVTTQIKYNLCQVQQMTCRDYVEITNALQLVVGVAKWASAACYLSSSTQCINVETIDIASGAWQGSFERWQVDAETGDFNYEEQIYSFSQLDVRAGSRLRISAQEFSLSTEHMLQIDATQVLIPEGTQINA